MTRKLKWALAAGVVMVFIAGVATGMFVGARRAHDVLAFNHQARMGERMRDHLIRELELTPQQLEKVSPIIDDTSRRLHDIRRESGQRVADTLRESHAAMTPHLTPQQRERLDALKERHKRSGHGRGHHHPPRDDRRPDR